MSADDFDPYYEWLGIPPEEQPANYYRLLGIREFEANAKAIANAADGRTLLLKSFQAGQHEERALRILKEISTARECLLDEQKRTEYDQQLRLEKVVNSRPAEFPKPRTRVQEPPVLSLAPEAPSTSSAGLVAQDSLDLPEIPEAPAAPKTPAAGLSAQETAALSETLEALLATSAGLSTQEPLEIPEDPAVPKTPAVGLSTQNLAGLSEDLEALLAPLPDLSMQKPPIQPQAQKAPSVLEPLGPIQPPMPPVPVPPSSTGTKPRIRLMLIGAVGVLVLCLLLWGILVLKKRGEPQGENAAQVQTQDENPGPQAAPSVENGKTADVPTSQEAETFYSMGEKFFAQKTYREAVYWYEKAMEKGSVEARYKLGVCCLQGLGVNENKEKAVEYFTTLAQQGHVPAQYELGLCCLKGEGTPQDKAAGLDWLQKAAEQGLEQAAAAIQQEKLAEEEQKELQRKERQKELAQQEEKRREEEKQKQQRLEEKQKADEARQKASRPGRRLVKVVDDIEYAFRWCPPGTFMMGSPDEEFKRGSGETQHQVTLSKGFWMLETEVTLEMFQSFVNTTGYKSKGADPFDQIKSDDEIVGIYDGQDVEYSWQNPGFIQEKSCPVVCVSWDDTVAFCKWLSEETELPISLPTEAQWEYACRAGTTTPFSFGDSLNGDKANCDGDLEPYGTRTKGVFLNQTIPAKSYAPNAWGLYDMHGNVQEWCQDGYGDYPSEPVVDPSGSTDDSLRVIRGGDWNSPASCCRSAARERSLPKQRECDLGFRVIGTGLEPENVPEDAVDAPSPETPVADARKPGKRLVKTVNGVEYVFHWCPAGTFVMGSPQFEFDRSRDETRHKVTLTRGFWMLETEVTQKMWQSVMKENPSKSKGSARPVENVSWDDCQEFLRRLNIPGLKLSLPTEAQWEYACRAGTKDSHSGKMLNDLGWYRENANGRTHSVGKKQPNSWGLYDMHGNVWEWCQDLYGNYPPGSAADPTGPSSGSHRVCRGGSWNDPEANCRSARRGSDILNYSEGSIGFRFIATSTEEDQ